VGIELHGNKQHVFGQLMAQRGLLLS